MSDKWHYRFLELAKFVSNWSRDPSTKVGAVIVDDNKRVLSMGFNGFPQGCDDDEFLYNDRNVKYDRTIHAETNAILFAQRSLFDCTLYTYPFLPCVRCATNVIQSRITTVIAPKLPDRLVERWGKSISDAKKLFSEAGVIILEMEGIDV